MTRTSLPVQAPKVREDWTLYGAMRYVGEEPEDAARYAYIYYYHSCEQDEETRRFAAYPESYRQNQLRDAIEAFDKGAWNRWFQRRHVEFDGTDYDNWTGDYSDITYNTIRALVYIACTDIDPDYIIYDLFDLDYDPSSEPIVSLANGEFSSYSRRTISFHKIGGGSNSSHYRDSGGHRYVPMEAVVNVAMEVDEQSGGDGRSRRTYKNAIRRLRKNGMVKWAEIVDGKDYRLYPESMPDPPEANRIKFEGKEYTPEPEAEEDAEQEIMTDGGKPTSDQNETATVKTYPTYREVAPELPELVREVVVGDWMRPIQDRVEQVLLFGSFASPYDEIHSNSDIDVFIICEPWGNPVASTGLATKTMPTGAFYDFQVADQWDCDWKEARNRLDDAVLKVLDESVTYLFDIAGGDRVIDLYLGNREQADRFAKKDFLPAPVAKPVWSVSDGFDDLEAEGVDIESIRRHRFDPTGRKQ